MNLEAIVSTYGYLAVFVGTFLEGETVLAIGGFFASRGYLDLRWVIAIAFLGTFSADQLAFHVGRIQGAKILAARPRWRAKLERPLELLHRHRILLIVGFRYVYGIRIITPFAIGMSGVRPMLFLLLDLGGAAVWATAMATLGYLFGYSVEVMIGRAEQYELWVVGGIAALGLAVWGLVRWRRARARKAAGSGPGDSGSSTPE